MTGPRFTSALAPLLEDYVAFKAAMGRTGTSRIWHLRQFDAYCTRNHRAEFDRDTVEGWVRERLARGGRHRSWMSYIRDMGRWLTVTGHPQAYVLDASWTAPFVPARPYLLTSAQVEAFFAAAARVPAVSPWRWQAVAFFALMHSCGLRTGEVRNLRREHVDARAGRLDVIAGKGDRSRRLPLSRQLLDILSDCDQASRGRFPTREAFFVSAAGNPVTPAAVGVMFARIWDAAGLPRPDGGPRPRPYDFRHHFAYANIERWMRDGEDVAALLPYLSRYMGHATFESTYYYVHTSPDFMARYGDLTAANACLLPPVGFA